MYFGVGGGRAVRRGVGSGVAVVVGRVLVRGRLFRVVLLFYYRF